MREIKFRAWDGEKMHSDVSPWRWDFVIDNSWHRCEKSTGDGILGSGGKTAEMLVPAIRFEKIMQYTGLKDKKGKEIYEGDIIRKAEYDWVVKWDLDRDQRTYAFVAYAMNNKTGFSGDKYNTFFLDESIISGEVIGNIYENPQLLNK